MPPFQVTTMTPIIGGLQNLYSPMVSQGSVYLGGWRDAGQTEDRIYRLVGPQIVEVLRRPGCLVNDPSLVPVPGGWVMYYTGLDTADLEHSNERNWLGYATSPDGGTWTDGGILVGRANGLDTGGVWSPGAVVVDDEIHVYAHSNAPLYRNYRLIFADDGLTLKGVDRLVLPTIPNTPASIPFASNLDVARKADGAGYWMVANSADLRTIVLLESDADGLMWTWVQGLMDGGTMRDLTPHLDRVTATGFDVLFGWTEIPHAWQSRSIHRWTWRRAT